MTRSVAADPRAITVRDYVERHRAFLLDDLDTWLRIPGISAQPEHHRDVEASAEWLCTALRAVGFPIVEVWRAAGGLPAVFAEWPSTDADAATVVMYGHHDVQPADPVELWTTPPFEPTVRGDDLYARGASDDKGQILFHLLGLRAHLAATGRDAPAVNLKFLIEGEEESGSPTFPALLDAHRDRLDCDVIVVTDTGMVAANQPSTVTGMRGIVAAQVDFHGPDVDLHSGEFGGAIPNPLTAIGSLIAALHDAEGRIQVNGFYDDVLELTETEQALLDAMPFDEAAFLHLTGSRALAGEADRSTLERIGARPTAEVNGMWGGYTGAGSKTIVPTDAHVKLSFRLVSDQQPTRIMAAVDRFVAAHVPAGIAHRVHWEGDGVSACLVDITTPAYAALTRAISAAFDGAAVLPTREGGSGPEAGLTQSLGAPLVFLGVGLPDDHIHSPNEKVTLSMLFRGAEAAAHLWSELAALGRSGLHAG